MDTKIRGNNSLLTKDQVGKLILLLHPSYDYLGITVTIYANKFLSLYDTFNPFKKRMRLCTFKQHYSGNIAGCHEDGEVFVFVDNYIKLLKDDTERIKLNAVFTLFHEIRHAYQCTYKERLLMNYATMGDLGYHSHRAERDANHFAERMMNKHKQHINEILNISSDWECAWGYFIIKK